VTGETAEKDPLVEYNGHLNADGTHTYWIDPATGASTWERPEPYAWTAAPSVEHPTQTYYHNTVRRRAGRGRMCARAAPG
jgi:hypothetical protein